MNATPKQQSIPKDCYQYDKVFEIIKKKQPQAIFFGGSTKDAARWVGNESGYAGTTNWCGFSGNGGRVLRLRNNFDESLTWSRKVRKEGKDLIIELKAGETLTGNQK